MFRDLITRFCHFCTATKSNIKGEKCKYVALCYAVLSSFIQTVPRAQKFRKDKQARPLPTREIQKPLFSTKSACFSATWMNICYPSNKYNPTKHDSTKQYVCANHQQQISAKSSRQDREEKETTSSLELRIRRSRKTNLKRQDG